ncbi:MAG: hypothetical protein WBB96_04875 [Candidatus Dechloromonas phosphoritropha]
MSELSMINGALFLPEFHLLGNEPGGNFQSAADIQQGEHLPGIFHPGS